MPAAINIQKTSTIMNRTHLYFHLVPTFAKAFPVLLLVSALTLCSLHAAPQPLFESGYQWKASPNKGKNAEASIAEETVDNASAVILDYDFSSVEEGSSVWVGFVADKDLAIQESDSPIRFRMKAAEPFKLKFALSDSNQMGHEVFVNYDEGGQWYDVEIPLEYQAFSLHCGGVDRDLIKQITYPIVRIGIFVVKTDSTAPKGTVTFADFPKK